MFIDAKRRQQLYDAYNRTCHICNRPISTLADMDLDHLTPKAEGGEDTLENLAPAHARCNRGKQAILRHVPKTHQLHLMPTRQTEPEPSTRIDNPESVLISYMRHKLAKGPQDSGLCQRVIDFARDRVDPTLSNNDGVTLYIKLHKQLGLVTKDVDGHSMTTFAPQKEED